MNGLKNVRNRRDDVLTRVRWDQLETLLVIYYRGQGYQVDHVGTGGTRAWFDGGIDLKLRKDDQYTLLQCKHWNAKQVPHNAVHALLGIMVNEGATGAILVTSGEFTKAAIEAATRHGHVQLIDGAELRAMIGPVPEPDPFSAPERAPIHLEPMVRDRGSAEQPPDSQTGNLVWKIAGGVILGLLAFNFLANAVDNYRQRQALEMFAKEMKRISADPDPLGWRKAAAAQQSNSQVIRQSVPVRQPAPPPHIAPARPALTAAEMREQKRKDDEATRQFNERTPEM